jgi:hypothetical protein
VAALAKQLASARLATAKYATDLEQAKADGDAWQLAALEWVFPEKPATRPLPGAPRRVPGSLPVRRRDLRPDRLGGPLPAHEPQDGRRLRVLAPGRRIKPFNGG